jgi:hypothetical protein
VARITLPWRTPNAAEYLAAGIAGAILPDAKSIVALFVPSGLTDRVAWYGDRFHGLFHAPDASSPIAGLSVELACTVVLLGLLVFLARARR